MEREICSVIEQALELKPGEVTVSDSAETIKKWDSLGLLAILTCLEKRFGSRVAEMDELAKVRSVREIVEIFRRENLI